MATHRKVLAPGAIAYGHPKPAPSGALLVRKFEDWIGRAGVETGAVLKKTGRSG